MFRFFVSCCRGLSRRTVGLGKKKAAPTRQTGLTGTRKRKGKTERRIDVNNQRARRERRPRFAKTVGQGYGETDASTRDGSTGRKRTRPPLLDRIGIQRTGPIRALSRRGRSAQVSITEVSASPDGKTDSSIRSIRRSGFATGTADDKRWVSTWTDSAERLGLEGLSSLAGAVWNAFTDDLRTTERGAPRATYPASCLSDGRADSCRRLSVGSAATSKSYGSRAGT